MSSGSKRLIHVLIVKDEMCWKTSGSLTKKVKSKGLDTERKEEE